MPSTWKDDGHDRHRDKKDEDEDVGPVRLERFSFRTVLWPSPLEEATLRREKS